MKLIKIKSNLTIVLNSGEVIVETNCSDELYNKIVLLQENDEDVLKLLKPELNKELESINKFKSYKTRVSESEILTLSGESVYLPTISEFSLPSDFVEAILEAEKNNDLDKIESYKNFWLLSCLNPDSRVRDNMFWFLSKYGMEITKSGLFVAYRNVEVYKEGSNIDSSLSKFITDSFMKVRYKLKKAAKNYSIGKKEGEYVCNINKDKVGDYLGNLKELYDNLNEKDTDKNESTIYTDNYTKTFRIQIGKIVSIPREDCDPNQNNTCSQGLHVGGKTWLEENYFGSVPLRVLVNPLDVVAVPHKDNYGKMRVCSYLPIQIVEFEQGKIKAENIDGFDDTYFNLINYKDLNKDIKNDGEAKLYTIHIPNCFSLNKENVIKNLDRIRLKISSKES